jgi:hypothetical protein
MTQRLARTAMFLLLMASPVAAQEWRPPDPKAEPWRDARLRIGPLFLDPTFQIKDFGVDDNVFNTPPGTERQDLTGTLSMTSRVGLQARALLVTVEQANSYIWYRTYTSERSVDGALRVVGELRLGRLRPWGAVGRAETHERGGFEIDARAGRETPTWDVGADLELGWRLGVTGAYRSRALRYAEGEEFDGVDLKEVLDHEAEEYRGYGRLVLTDFTTAIGGVEYSRMRFDFSPIRDSDDVYYFGGLESSAESRLGLNLKVGWMEQRHTDPTVAGFKGLAASGSTTFIVGDFMQLRFSGERRPGLSYEEAYPYYVQQGGEVRSHIRFNPYFDLVFDGRASWLRYRDTVTGVSAPRLDRTTVFGAEFGYYFGGSQGTRVGIRYEYAERTSPLVLKNYARSRIYSAFRLSF